MLILCATNQLRIGGTETFTVSLVKELEKRGHTVDLFTMEPGPTALLMAKNMVSAPKPKYDLILINHITCLRALQRTEGPKVFTSHGIYPEIEQPVDGADHYVGISQEILDHNDREMDLIHNGIDCEAFKPVKEINEELRTVFCLCQGEKAKKIVEEACEAAVVDCIILDKREQDIRPYIQKADLVVSLGRGAYEAMAAGRNVIVYDTRGYTKFQTADGIVTPENADEIIKNNFSGRRYKIPFSVTDMVEELMKYKKEYGAFNREYALKNFNIETQVDKYLEYAK